MISLAGTSHHRLNTAERAGFGLRLTEAAASWPHRVLLRTCNRDELYVSDSVPAGLSDEPAAYVRQGREAIHHLLRVLCGLDSALLGETEITGQVRRAYDEAARRRLCDRQLHRTFQRSLRIAREIRAAANWWDAGLSYARAAVDWVFQAVVGRKPEILLVGSGAMGRAVLQEFKRRKRIRCVTVTRRNPELLDELRATFGVRTLPRDEAFDRIGTYDALITATAAPHPVVTRETLPCARMLNGMVVCDLSAPANVEPALLSLAARSRSLDDFIRDFDRASSSSPSREKAEKLARSAVEEIVEAGD